MRGPAGDIRARLPRAYAVDKGKKKYPADILTIAHFALCSYPAIKCGFGQPSGPSLNGIVSKHSDAWYRFGRHDLARIYVIEGLGSTLKVDLLFKADAPLIFVAPIAKKTWLATEGLYEYIVALGLWKGDKAIEGLELDIGVDLDFRDEVEKMKKDKKKKRKTTVMWNTQLRKPMRS
jgi:hypothetical protein